MSTAASSVPGSAKLEFRRRANGKTIVATAFASSPLRLLMPANHGRAAWVFLASLGGGLVDGDRIGIDVEVSEGAWALLGTQSSTKVYRSPEGGAGTSQRLSARVAADAVLAVVPDPVVCFADARYEQAIDVALDPTASLCLVDAYSSGRSARGERWAFGRYASRTTVTRGGARSIVDATRLEPQLGPLADRMGRFDAMVTLLAIGPRLGSVRQAMLSSSLSEPARAGSVLVAASPLGEDGCILRVAAERFESASLALRSSFASLAAVLGDDPLARKW
jgi:urease accessory protein